MGSKNFTYENSGVSIKKADKFIKFISSSTKKSKKSGKFKNIGGFGALTKLPSNLKNPYLVTSTDGVGTKIEVANLLGKFDTIGVDLVAMCVNDIIVQGAKPLLFLDYISVEKIDTEKLKNIIEESKSQLTQDNLSDKAKYILSHKVDTLLKINQ